MGWLFGLILRIVFAPILIAFFATAGLCLIVLMGSVWILTGKATVTIKWPNWRKSE